MLLFAVCLFSLFCLDKGEAEPSNHCAPFLTCTRRQAATRAWPLIAFEFRELKVQLPRRRHVWHLLRAMSPTHPNAYYLPSLSFPSLFPLLFLSPSLSQTVAVLGQSSAIRHCRCPKVGNIRPASISVTVSATLRCLRLCLCVAALPRWFMWQFCFALIIPDCAYQITSLNAPWALISYRKWGREGGGESNWLLTNSNWLIAQQLREVSYRSR